MTREEIIVEYVGEPVYYNKVLKDANGEIFLQLQFGVVRGVTKKGMLLIGNDEKYRQSVIKANYTNVIKMRTKALEHFTL